MNLLVTGKGGKSGSWKVRGEQLGAALGAHVKPLASAQDMRAADLTIVVKRTPDALVASLRYAKARWVYDIVDCYPQPLAASWARSEAVKWVRERLLALRPDAVIWPNARMREDCNTGLPGMVLPHHCRPGIEQNPIREQVKIVGYEGRPDYLARWEQTIETECERRGWWFRVNPTSLANVDIVIAFRSGHWDGYATRHWKSAVKLANAHGSGTPFIGQRESGYQEMATGCEYWADSTDELKMSFDWLESQSTREMISDRFKQAAYSVDAAASDLRSFLEAL